MMNLEWYNLLNTPPLTPPSGIFSPVWIVLYISIFISLMIFITTSSETSKIKGYSFFILQMILNLLWTPTFFILKNIGASLIIIILLAIIIIININEFYKISKLAAWILIPYLIWVLFATYLNAGFYILN